MQATADNICTLILAGGRGSRLQHQDKGLIEWQGQAMIEHILSRIQGDHIIISANRNIERYQSYGYPVVQDELDDYQGPLAGLLAAMKHTSRDYILSLPCDSPSPPENLQTDLIHCLNRQQKQSAICHDGERLQPLFALISRQYLTELNDFLRQGKRKVQDFFHSIDPAICDFSAQAAHFHNINRPEDLL